MNTFILHLYNLMCNLLPETRCWGLKRTMLRCAGANIGNNVRIVSSASYFLSGPLEVGDDTWIGHYVSIVGGDALVRIGHSCDIAPKVMLVTGSHEINYQECGRVAGYGYSLPIIIEDESWVCAGSVILGGTTIGRHSIVAAGSVVKGEFPERSLIGGNPAKVLRQITALNVKKAPADCEDK
ncbi:acyltransferase [Mariprofundus erugo]|uniref:Acyltransferase n=1 Tax=Mariprofundus erugo TaxID=2528639 RepID=A0A5R9GU51_9PROT|nr:acyltransferase [Mariprofundus erugo]TLS66744.1 acyltransferase [Mariprofundus erugo]